ncbi:hypothetical protein MNBD_GAMMA26-1551 [hydrothermal vent metagenome]|uniref:Cytochrome c7-like domain-containing protein n=1 Tax=hydrothermal vent metagenome TaxID=652676 RepID=A0A3B1B0H4_9ZZZZ
MLKYTLLFVILLYSCFPVLAQEQATGSRNYSAICQKFMKTDCDAHQESLLRLYLGNADIQGLSNKLETYPGAPLAFSLLPKDHAGFVNWNKAVTDGLIRPRSSLSPDQKDEYEGYLANLMVFQTKVPAIPDVIFPHGMHTYWLSCDSCHPEPFKKERGSNNFTMGHIIEGKYCGKCHGKVAFPPESFKNCNRCHILKKTKLRPWSEVPD